jgi:hypothetical protein
VAHVDLRENDGTPTASAAEEFGSPPRLTRWLGSFRLIGTRTISDGAASCQSGARFDTVSPRTAARAWRTASAKTPLARGAAFVIEPAAPVTAFVIVR